MLKIRKSAYRMKNEAGEYEIHHFQTSADQVLFNEGANLEQKVNTLEQAPRIVYGLEEPANAENGTIWIVGE